MCNNDSPRQEGTDPKTVTLELTPSEARQIHGLLHAEHQRCRHNDEPAERRWAPYFARLKEEVMVSLKGAADQ